MTDVAGDFSKLLEQAQNGDEAALGEILDQHRPWLRFLGQRGLGQRFAGRVDESDVAQVTFLSAVRQFDRFEGNTPDELAAWLRVIHERNLQDAVRKHVDAQMRSVDNEQTMVEEEIPDIELTSPSAFIF